MARPEWTQRRPPERIGSTRQITNEQPQQNTREWRQSAMQILAFDKQTQIKMIYIIVNREQTFWYAVDVV